LYSYSFHAQVYDHGQTPLLKCKAMRDIYEEVVRNRLWVGIKRQKKSIIYLE
jgi:hypothetical protein